MANPVNLLILDEPTNHLDLPSCDRLEDALNAYPGTLILVTHDRHLIRNVADALIVVRNGTATWHEGVNEDLLRPVPMVVEPGRESATSANQHNEAREDRKNEARRRNKMREATKGLRDELSRAERSWEKAEEELAQLQTQLGDSSTYEDPELVKALSKRHEELKDNAAGLMEMYETIQRRLVRKEAEFD
jgi:ATP-binding cassette subfamily F protein 3